MNSITNLWTDQTPSRFAMPICASALVGGVEIAVRERRTAVTAHRATAFLPGTRAWRPPIC